MLSEHLTVVQVNDCSCVCVCVSPVRPGDDLLAVDDHELLHDLACELLATLGAVRVPAHAAYPHVLQGRRRLFSLESRRTREEQHRYEGRTSDRHQLDRLIRTSMPTVAFRTL